MTPAATSLLVFGGSFDPPHWGHMNLLKNAMEAARPQRVLVMPSATSPHKEASQTPWALRADMCRCFFPLSSKIFISDVEERRGGKSYTYDTICQLEKEYPGVETFYLCVGSDMLESFTAWHRWRELLQKVTLVAMPRTDGELCALRAGASVLQSAGGRVLFAPGPVVDASSTAIRQALAAGDEAALELVPPPADSIIREKGLYQA